MTDFKKLIIENSEMAYRIYLPHISIDTVIFGFEEHELQVLLLKMKYNKEWFLPGGYLLKEENMGDAANRILLDRAGVRDIFLKEFAVFGDSQRSQDAFKDFDSSLWHKQRFVTVGYYALVDFKKVTPVPDALSETCEWVPLSQLTSMQVTMDHRNIIDQALHTLRTQLSFQPIGYNLLPKNFTLVELQTLYEIILGKKLNRGNFYRKIKNLGILRKLQEQRNGKPHKPADLYTFDLELYQKALENDLDRW